MHDLENEIRGLLKIFGVKLPIRLSPGGFDVAMRDTIESDPALSQASCRCCMRVRCC